MCGVFRRHATGLLGRTVPCCRGLSCTLLNVFRCWWPSQSLYLPEMHPPIFPVTRLLLREVSTASSWTDGDTHTPTFKNPHCYCPLSYYVMGSICTYHRRDREIEGRCGDRNKHFVKCQLCARQTCPAFKSRLGHRFSSAFTKTGCLYCSW